MRIVVSDSSCLIDLRKALLLDVFLKLPYEILIPNTLFEDELLKFTDEERARLLEGLEVVDLPGERVLRARQVARDFPQLSIHDSFAVALAEHNPGCILLTGDAALRDLATEQNIEVHGILWVIDQLHANALVAPGELARALRMFAGDPTVRLPRQALAAYIKRYERMV